ncbi:MAG: glycosyltransferase family 4 protein [Planctomycetota bacterium]
MMKHRIAVQTGAPAPYREPVFEELARRPGVELKVFYAAFGHGDLGWLADPYMKQADYRAFLDNWTPRRFQRMPLLGYCNTSISRAFERFHPTYAIVYGYSQLVNWLAIRHCMRHGVPFALRTDSNVWLDTRLSWRSELRRGLLRRLVPRAAGILAVGSANRMYWQRYGATDHQLFMAPYAVDNRRVRDLASRSDARPTSGLKFLYCGRLIPRKGVDQLLAAFEELHVGSRCRLTIIGDGPERSRLEAMQSQPAREATRWLGKLANDDALREFGGHDVLVLPSRHEPWGLVVNEAMAAGLPVIADHRCGAACDLIHEGKTGWKLRGVTKETLKQAMLTCIQEPSLVAAAGEAARRHVQSWSIERTVDGFLEAIESASHRADIRRRTREVAHA